jgi:hypothetical protein
MAAIVPPAECALSPATVAITTRTAADHSPSEYACQLKMSSNRHKTNSKSKTYKKPTAFRIFLLHRSIRYLIPFLQSLQ